MLYIKLKLRLKAITYTYAEGGGGGGGGQASNVGGPLDWFASLFHKNNNISHFLHSFYLPFWS